MSTFRAWRGRHRASGARAIRTITIGAAAIIAAGGLISLSFGDAGPWPSLPGPGKIKPLIALEGQTTGAAAEADHDAAADENTHSIQTAAYDRRVPGKAVDQGEGSASLRDAYESAGDALPRFNGRPIRPVDTMQMVVTAYSPCAESCAPYDDGITASGRSVYTNGGNLVAADTSLLPFGSIVSIPGYNDGLPVPVLDRGGAIKGNRLDVLYPTHNHALQWGVQTLDVVVWEYAD